MSIVRNFNIKHLHHFSYDLNYILVYIVFSSFLSYAFHSATRIDNDDYFFLSSLQLFRCTFALNDNFCVMTIVHYVKNRVTSHVSQLLLNHRLLMK